MRFAVLAAAAACAACNPPTVTFDVPVDAETTIQEGGLIDEILDAFGFEDFANVDLEGTQQFQNNDVRREQVVSARLTSLNLAIVEPQGANFDWLDSLSFSVAADGIEEERVASADIPDGEAAVALDLDDVDVAPYVRSPTMEITTEANARRPPQDTTVRVDVNFRIVAEVL